MSSPTNRNEPPHGPDGVDGWLNGPIEPLPPRPGTYEAIVRRARRRRLARAVTAAGAAAAVVAAAVLVPRAAGLLTPRENTGQALASPSHSARASQQTGNRGTAPSPEATGAGPVAAPVLTTASVTFIGLDTGWALGRYIPPCPAGGCTALARTDDTGQHWHSVPAPGAGPPDGDAGVSQVRFLNRADGWVFGPQLWATHDGGQTWNKISTDGQRVISLETAGTRVLAVFARCTGTGAAWNTGCVSHQLYSAAAGGGTWAPVAGGSGPGTARLVLTSQAGYLLAQDGGTVTLSSGPVTGARWSAAAPVPCGQQPGSPAPGPGGSTGGTGAPGPAALLAAASPKTLFLVCSAGGGPPGAPMTVYGSADGGGHWQQRGTAPSGGSATSVAAAAGPAGVASPGSSQTAGGGGPPASAAPASAAPATAAPGSSSPRGGTVLIASSSGIYLSRDGGTTWQMPLQVPGGISYVGMTDPLQGFAVPAGHGGVWFTTDGGLSWHQSQI